MVSWLQLETQTASHTKLSRFTILVVKVSDPSTGTFMAWL